MGRGEPLSELRSITKEADLTSLRPAAADLTAEWLTAVERRRVACTMWCYGRAVGNGTGEQRKKALSERAVEYMRDLQYIPDDLVAPLGGVAHHVEGRPDSR